MPLCHFLSPFTTSIISCFKKLRRISGHGLKCCQILIFSMFYFSRHHRATLCSSSNRNIQNTLVTEVLKAAQQHLKKIMCWPLCQPCQKNANPSLAMDSKSHTHTHTLARKAQLQYNSALLCGDRGWAVKQRLCLGCRLALPLPMSAGRTLPGQLALGMPQWSRDVWCHPITTQAAADSTHGKCVRVHALKHTGRKENNCMFGGKKIP